MKFFWKAKGFMLGKDEIEIITGQIYNYIVKKKLVFIAELEPFFKGLSSFEKLRIIEHLKKEKKLIFEEDMLQYKESESFETFLEG